jgi:hypothetical protein
VLKADYHATQRDSEINIHDVVSVSGLPCFDLPAGIEQVITAKQYN